MDKMKLFTILSFLLCLTILIYLIKSNQSAVYDIRSKEHYDNIPFIKNASILQKIRFMGSPCLCQNNIPDLKSSVSKDKLEATDERRTKEYKTSQMRIHRDKILIAPSNSPLQYPAHGFSVVPLKITSIPGLGVNSQGRGVYKVTLRVSLGVLSVDGDLMNQVIEGQGGKVLSLSVTSVEILNKILAKITYTSSIYHLKTTDMAHFIYEDYEAMFPIEIKRPAVPVLYDQGNDINSQVTITTKTFLRYKELRALIKSIRRRYPDMKIIIADDNFDTEKVEGPSIEQYFMPPSQGWFAGRNLAVSQVTTKYFLWVDDDYEFLDQTNIEKFVEIMEAVPDLDVLGGSVDGGRFYFTLEYEEGDEEEGGCLSRNQGGKYHNIPGFDHCFLTDGVVNFFLARTDSVRKVGFDPQLRRVAHSEFFMDGLGKLMVASCNGFAVGHQTRQKNAKYDGFRHPGQTDTEFKLAHHYFKNHLKCVKY
ncbi:beta-1,4 N-acetylgalactosaminyltransferase 2-like [Denticeps clupeoides]|uniref:Glycosyltransferase 2-like domain-containing protein n=1 Tax=Denticeps clupeoides TaxID=299321 RepID=A0AAY4BQQ1_9TELE|nr:beta-1,4 N-acetylgalactosaminyltransferase 2-like [Denticeps clupeoides]